MSVRTKLGQLGQAVGASFTPRANLPRSDVQSAVEFVMDNAENVGTPYAPTDAEYLTNGSATGLSNERAVTDTDTIVWDFSETGQAKALLQHLGIESLTDPGADRVMGWDDSEGGTAWLTPASGLGISGTNLSIVDPDLVAIVSEANFAQGDLLFHNGTTLDRLPIGSALQMLRSNGAGQNPSWVDAPDLPSTLAAQLAAEAARDAAIIAQGAAEQAEENAETAETNAETAETNAETAEAAAKDAQSYAEEWAINPENDPVSVAAGGDDATTYSALHWAAKSEDFKDDAESAASSASGSASTATTQAGIATTQAGIATTQAGIATTQAGIATTQAGIATGAAQDAEAAFDAFDDIYLGSKASDPALDNDGDPLVEGQLYWNSTSNNLRIYDGAAWQAYSPTGGITDVVQDTSPQLGGDLDLNSFDIEGTGNINITGTIDCTGDVTSQGGGNFLGGSIPTSAAAGVYWGKENANDNRAIQIVTGHTQAYIDFASAMEDYSVRLIATMSDDSFAITAAGGVTISHALTIGGQLGGVTSLDSTTEATIEAAIDTLGSLTSIQGVSFTFGAYAATLLNNANEAGFKAAVNLEPGVDVQAYDADLASWAGVTRASGFDTFAATPSLANFGSLLTDEASGLITFMTTPSSANLRALLTDESGSGLAYFQGGDIGTPSAGVATNLTGLPLSSGVSGQLPLGNGGTGANLSDPNRWAIMGWNDTANAVQFLALADIPTEGDPETGDYLLGIVAGGGLVKIDAGDVGSGDMLSANNLSDVADAVTSRENLLMLTMDQSTYDGLTPDEDTLYFVVADA